MAREAREGHLRLPRHGGSERPLESLEEHFRNTDVVSPNETELKRLTGMPVSTEADVIKAAEYLQSRGAPSVLVTLGSQGSLMLQQDGSIVKQQCFQAPSVVDETGAGDNFRSAFVIKHAHEGRGIKESLESQLPVPVWL